MSKQLDDKLYDIRKMSWTTLLWTVLAWTGYIYPSSSDPTYISYNWYDFLRVGEIQNRFDRWTLDLSSYDTIKAHWMWFDQAFIKSKIVIVRWVLSATTSSLLEEEIDSLIRACQKPNQLLKIKRKNWDIVQAYATVTNVIIPEKSYNITFIPYEVEITILEPFLFKWPLSETSWLSQAWTLSETIAFADWNEVGLPFVLIEFKWWTSATQVTVQIWTKAITVNASFTNWDTLLVNSKNKEVMKWVWNNVSFAWEFPELEFWNNSLDISVVGTYLADIYLLYYPSYA